MKIASGSYVGDGQNGREVTSVGFQPDVVIIKGKDIATEQVVSTSAHPADLTSYFHGVSPDGGLIESLDADGFTVGSDQTVNDDGSTYYYLALANDGDDDLVVGSYTGNGAPVEAQEITGFGWRPDLVCVFPEDGNREPMFVTDFLDGNGGGIGLGYGWGPEPTFITAADGFEAGGTGLNATGVEYYYFAARKDAGNLGTWGPFTGSGFDDEPLVTGTGTSFSFVFIGNHHLVTPAYRFGAQTGDASFDDTQQVEEANVIQDITGDQLTFGDSVSVNENGEDYYGWGFGPPIYLITGNQPAPSGRVFTWRALALAGNQAAPSGEVDSQALPDRQQGRVARGTARSPLRPSAGTARTRRDGSV